MDLFVCDHVVAGRPLTARASEYEVKRKLHSYCSIVVRAIVPVTNSPKGQPRRLTWGDCVWSGLSTPNLFTPTQLPLSLLLMMRHASSHESPATRSLSLVVLRLRLSSSAWCHL